MLSIWREGSLAASLFGFDESQKELFMKHVPRILSRSESPADAASTEISALERRLSSLARNESSSLASDLADLGLSGLDDEELREFSSEKGRAVARELYRLSAVARSAWIIGEAAERAAEIVKAVRDYVIESGSEGQCVEVDLRGTIERALLILKNRQPKSVEIRAEFDALPPVLGSEGAFVRIWAALIQNALQAMPEGGRLELSLRRDGDLAAVSIVDDGLGVDPSIEARLFEPFVTTRHMAEGMGLGLSFCKRSVESFGGDIAYFRREKGSEFRVRLPLGRSAAPEDCR